LTKKSYRILQGDAFKRLKELPDESAHCCITSPPYWRLRDYGVEGQLGLERTPEEYVASLIDIFAEIRRVLRKDGTLWLNLGDSYIGGGRGGKNGIPHGGIEEKRSKRGTKWGAPTGMVPGLKRKDLAGIPWRVAFALQADGWYLRQDIVWYKPNPMPESVTDRCTKAHEYVFLLTKAAKYYYNARDLAEPLQSDPASWGRHNKKDPGLQALSPRAMFGPSRGGRDGTEWGNGKTRNRRSVWTIASQAYPEAHFATFPEALVEPMVMAGSRRGDIILDPFSGAGTAGVVALKLGRKYLGIELNPDYVEMSKRRLAPVAVQGDLFSP